MSEATPRVIWQGAVLGENYRVIDTGGLIPPRLVVEVQLRADALGGRGWTQYEPIPTLVFSAMLIAAGVVT